MRWQLIFGVLLVSAASESYRILVVFPCISRSHAILGESIVRHLLKAGHEVTYITPYPVSIDDEKLQLVNVAGILSGEELSFEDILNNKFVLDNEMMYSSGLNFSKSVLVQENVQALLDSTEAFDAVIAEWLFNEFFSGLATIYQCPMIWLNTMYSHWAARKLMDGSTNPAYTADITSSNIPPFSFVQRVKELWTQITVYLFYKLSIVPETEEAYRNLIAPILVKRGQNVPEYSEISYNASLMLCNYHHSFGKADSFPQNYVNIGGYHIPSRTKPLSDELQLLMDNAENGVIYFSMGSNLLSKNLPNEIKAGLLRTFSQLRQTVIWKFEEVLPNLPKNVHILKWAPQHSILAHPNCVLFITHGGLLSTIETLHFGVPIIGIPVFIDQRHNVRKAVLMGYGKHLELNHDLPVHLKDAIQDVLGDFKYRKKVKELSAIYHHRPVSPASELIHWVEHVIQTKGALHLRSPALLVPWYQKIYLDLAGLLLLAMFTVVIVLRCFYRILLGKFTKLHKKRE